MSTKKRYSIEFKEHALRRAFARGERTISNVAADLNMTSTTLKDWMKAQRKVSSTPKAAAAYSPADRLLALQKTFSLSEEALSAWCREQGLFVAQLEQWRTDFISESVEVTTRNLASELRDLKVAHGKLEFNLRRKDQALAEAAALLVLQKKFQALFSAEA